MYFKNTSNRDTPILADIQAIHTTCARPAGPNVMKIELCLHHPAAVVTYQRTR